MDNQALLELKPIKSKDDKEGCFSAVRIHTNLMEESDDIVWLLAKDKRSNETFKCRVGFGKIKRLVISKRFDRMNVGELIEVNVNVIYLILLFRDMILKIICLAHWKDFNLIGKPQIRLMFN